MKREIDILPNHIQRFAVVGNGIAEHFPDRESAERFASNLTITYNLFPFNHLAETQGEQREAVAWQRLQRLDNAK